MNKKFTSLLAWALCCLTSTSAWALDKNAEGVYQISNADQLIEFANIVNGVNVDADPGASAMLTADVDLTDINWTPMGSDAHRYSGTFDGCGFSIKNMKIEGSTKELGLFSVVTNATIKNLVIDKSCIINSGPCTAALVGCCNGSGTLTIENVGVECDVKGTDQNCAAFVGCNYSGGGLKIIIKNSYNTGNVTGGWECAVFSGWFANNAEVINSWSTGKVTGQDGNNSLGRGIGSENFVNTYDLNSENEKVNATVLANYENSWMASGKLCYTLNGNSSATPKWFQKIGTEDHPKPFGIDVVYANGALQCDGITPVEGGEVTFSNTEGSTVEDHHFNKDGLCDNCNAPQPDYLTANAEGFIELGNGKHLNWFAHYATKNNQQANALLTDNIDMKEVNNFPGIGFDGKAFSGTLDGQTHIIKNLVMDMPEEDNVGLIRDITAGAVVKNITIDATCSFKGKKFTSAFIGHASGNGTVQLEQLGNEADVETVDQNAGAIVGCNTSGELKLTVVNCYNTGTITSGWEAGGLSGWFGNDAVTTNCYNMGMVVNGESFARGNNIQITNCFDPVTNWPALPSSPIEDFTNGTIYKSLSEAAPGIWFLSAETDGHPVLYDTGITTGIASLNIQHSTLNSHTYNLNGQRVKQAQKGLYVINGRIVIK